MGSLFEVTEDGVLKAQGFLVPIQDFGNYTPTITLLDAGLSSITAAHAYFIKTGRNVNINIKFSITVGSGIPNIINTPIFTFTLPFDSQLASKPVGCTSMVYKEGNNLGTIGTMRLETATASPTNTNNVNVFINNNNNSVFNNTGNNPFSAQFEFTYLSV